MRFEEDAVWFEDFAVNQISAGVADEWDRVLTALEGYSGNALVERMKLPRMRIG